MHSTLSSVPYGRTSIFEEVFDQLAPDYDQTFTNSHIGRAQRNVVWKILDRTFRINDNILELNCGTGEDAIHLATRGISVFACDASQEMIAKAEYRISHISESLPVVFCHLSTEQVSELRPDSRFDGVFSNFSGLNCIEDLSSVASALSNLVKPGGHLLLCLSTRFCLIEIAYYLCRGHIKKAMRRCSGRSVATFKDLQLPVYYPTLRQLRRSFAPHFKLQSYTGIGVAVPPSYCERWALKHPSLFRFLCRLESVATTLPMLRVTGDHVLICFEKVASR